jgi:serine protease
MLIRHLGGGGIFAENARLVRRGKISRPWRGAKRIDMPIFPTTLHPEARTIVVAAFAALLTSCSSGGGGGGGSTPEPTVQLEAEPSNIIFGGTATLTWSSTNADTCAASGGWTGTRPVSGSEDVGPLTASTNYSLQCNGQGGSDSVSATVTLLAGTGTVAGQLLVPTISRSDGDVNDPVAPFAPNDTDQEAQIMPNPVVIGGYLNEPNAGPDNGGRSFALGDLDDWYRVDLVAGQVIELVMPSATEDGDDADLHLYDSSLNLVGVCEGTGQVEQLTVPADGTYFIDVFLFGGAPLYRLSVGQSSVVPPGGSDLCLSDDFVAGELIVTLKSAGDSAAKTAKSDEVLAARYKTSRKGGDPGRAMLLKLPADAGKIANSMMPSSRAASATSSGGTTAPGGSTAMSKPRRPRVASAAQQRKLDTLRFAKLLRKDPDVRFADLNRVMRVSVEPNDVPGYAIQRWHYEQIQLPSAWELTKGSGIPVAVVDTGVALHPELASKLIDGDGRDFISDPTNPDGDGRDANPADPGCGISGGSIFHGTHVAGTIGARSNDGTGVAGVSWGAKIMPIRALDGCTGSGNSFDIIQGIRYAAGLDNDSGTKPSTPAKVINMSFGALGTCDATVEELFEAVRAQGAVVVAAAGNDNTSAPATPASCRNVISVASVGPLRTKAPYSNFGSTVDVSAPGGDMRRDVNGDGHPDGVYSTHAIGGGAVVTPTFELLQGTSMAAPHVAGVIALMLSVDPAPTPERIDTLLAQGLLTDDIGVPNLGAGLINAQKAIRAVDPSAPPLPPTLSVTPSSLAFGDVGTVAEVVASNAGDGTLTVDDPVTVSETWLSVTPTSVDENRLGRYEIAVDRTGLDVNSYSGFVEFTSDGGTERVEVLMEVAEASGEPDAGRQYVLLVDAATDEALTQVDVLADGSSVAYEFKHIPSGDYLVISGTDLNNDRFICDPAEACGAYPVENSPETIVVDGAVTGIDFLVAYRTGVPTTTASKAASKDVRPELRRRRIMR